MNVGISYNAFVGPFKKFFPELKVINSDDRISEFDLIIFPGGEDINPELYGERNKFSDYNDERDVVERMVFYSWQRARNKPKILGICRGHQFVNVSLGGRLVQDLFTIGRGHLPEHKLEIAQKTEVTDIFSGGVNSTHHQAVIKPGEGQFITAWWNGTIEITESENILTLQCHPEFNNNIAFFDWLRKKVSERSPFYVPEGKPEREEPNAVRKCLRCGDYIMEESSFFRKEDGYFFCSSCKRNSPGTFLTFDEFLRRRKDKQLTDNIYTSNTYYDNEWTPKFVEKEKIKGTKFDIKPGTADPETFREVSERENKNLEEFLDNLKKNQNTVLYRSEKKANKPEIKSVDFSDDLLDSDDESHH